VEDLEPGIADMDTANVMFDPLTLDRCKISGSHTGIGCSFGIIIFQMKEKMLKHLTLSSAFSLEERKKEKIASCSGLKLITNRKRKSGKKKKKVLEYGKLSEFPTFQHDKLLK
jgi:hypothetical protein